MALRGEKVGDAYVRIHADGRGMDRDVERELSKVDAKKAGSKAGEDYSEGFGDAFERRFKKTYSKTLKKSLKDSNRIGRETGDIFGGEAFKGIENQLRSRFPAMGGRVADDLISQLRAKFQKSNLGESFFRGGQKSGLAAFFKQVETMAADSQIKIEKLDAASVMARNEIERKGYVERDRLRDEDFDQHILSLAEIGKAEKRSASAIAGLDADRAKRRRKNNADERRDWDAQFRELSRTVGKIVIPDVVPDSLFPRLRRFDVALSGLSERTGRAFGKGSRNDALNLFGAIAGGSLRATAGVFRFGENLLTMGSKFKTAFSAARATEGIFASLRAGFSGAASGAGSLGAALTAGAVAIPIIVILVGTLVSAISALIGIFVALASTISFAVVGAVAVLGGAFTALLIGVGALAFAIKSMDDQTKKALKTAIKPFTDEARRLGQVLADNAFQNAVTWAKEMKGALGGLEPLAAGLGLAFSDIGDYFVAALTSEGFTNFKIELSQFLPAIIENLGKAFVDTLGGFGGLFAAILPHIERFSVWLSDIAKDFSDWANSAEGQNSIADFMDKAFESAEALGGFLGELNGLIGDLLFNATGKATGDSIFDSMAGAIATFREYIADGELEQWFEDAKDFAESLGEALSAVGDALDALDSPGFRSFAGVILEMLGEMFETFSNLVAPISDVVTALDSLFEGDWSGLGQSITSLFKDLGILALDALTLGFGDELASAFDDLDWAGAGQSVVNGLASALVAVGGFGTMLSTKLGAAKESVSSFASHLGSKFTEGSGVVTAKIGEISSAIGGRLSSAFNTAKSKASEVASSFGGSVRGGFESLRSKAGELSSSLSGRLSDAFGSVRGTGSRLLGVFDSIRNKFDSVKDAVRRLINELRNIDWPSPPGWLSGAANRIGGLFTASGGVFNGAQTRVIGEAGAEAVVPLDRPLSQVDPAVRWLSAIAQGKIGTPSGGGGRTVDASGWTIITPTKDPVAVAHEVLNEITGKLG